MKPVKNSPSGFTLIETLVALLLITLMIPVVFESQIVVIRAEKVTRASEAVVLQISRVMVESFCGRSVTNRPNSAITKCSVNRSVMKPDEQARQIITAAGMTRYDMIRWELVPDERPAMKTIIFTRLFP